MPSSPRVRPLADHQSLRERIVERLRDAILAGDLPAQTRLREPDLAKRLAVSRTPLREAIRQLEAEGLLTTVPRVGAFVTAVTLQDLEETYAIRAVLEGLAARQAAARVDPERAARLRALLDELGQKTANYRIYHEAAGRFHDAIFDLAGNRRLRAMYEALTRQVARAGCRSPSASGPIPRSGSIAGSPTPSCGAKGRRPSAGCAPTSRARSASCAAAFGRPARDPSTWQAEAPCASRANRVTPGLARDARRLPRCRPPGDSVPPPAISALAGARHRAPFGLCAICGIGGPPASPGHACRTNGGSVGTGG